nr:helitron helicase-like domain-containing protein [Tanacetum cinerariifolium]
MSEERLDVKNAFLNGDFSDIVYMYQPPGFVDACFPHHVGQLQRCFKVLQVMLSGLVSCRVDLPQRINVLKLGLTLLVQLVEPRTGPETRPDVTGVLKGVTWCFQGERHGLHVTKWTNVPTLVLQVICSISHLLVKISLTQRNRLQLYTSTIDSFVSFSDADWAGCPTTKGSTSVVETAWLCNLVHQLYTPLLYVTLAYCDNVSAIYLTFNPVQHQRTKYVKIDIRFIHDMVVRGQVRVLHEPSRYQYLDIFTKGLSIRMQRPHEPPEYIKGLFENKHFMENIRAYNQMFAMTSSGAKIDDSINVGQGPYVFKVTDNSQLEHGIVKGRIHFLDAHNELVHLFPTARDKCRELDISEFKIRLYNAEGTRGYVLPTSNALGAMVFENGTSYTYSDLGDYDRRCRYCGASFWYVECLKGHSHNQTPEYHLCCGVGRIRMQRPHEPPEYIKGLFENKHFMENICAYNQMFAMTSSGAKIDDSINVGQGPYVFKVTGQIYHWIGSLCPPRGEPPRELDISEFKIRLYNAEGTRGYELPTSNALGAMVFENEPAGVHKKKQNDIRSDYLSGLYDTISRGERDGYEVGGGIILPMSFTGNPRYMYAHYLDALAIYWKLGNPQFFITFTYAVCRVFEQKIQALIAFLKEERIFRDVTGVLYTVKFQKRGLPHCHTLLWVDSESTKG